MPFHVNTKDKSVINLQLLPKTEIGPLERCLL